MSTESEAPAQNERKPRRGDILNLTIERLDNKGQGVGHVEWPPFESFLVAVRHAPPGSQVEVEVVRRRGSNVDAKRLRWLDHGPHFSQPLCQHFGTCGGCSFQNLAYGRQLEELQGLVTRALQAHDQLGDVAVEPVIGMAEPFGYRNKMDFTFGTKRWLDTDEPEGVQTDFALGLHVPFRHDKVMDVHQCSIAFPGADALVVSARALALKMGLSAWDLKEHAGLLRHLVVRHGLHTDQVLVYLVTSAEAPEQVLPYVKSLCARHPEITTVVQGVHTGLATVAWGERDLILHGPGYIEESLLGTHFRIQPKSFFQTNTLQAERLIEVVREEAQIPQTEDPVVYDLYCGTGILGLMSVPKGGQLVGFEVVASAVEDARGNAERLGHGRAQFVEGDVLEQLGGGAWPAPDVLIVDPPRAGLHPKVVPVLGALPAKRLVYVSCNVKNAARDLVGLAESGWKLVRVRPLDLFPHTPHVECVLTLERTP